MHAVNVFRQEHADSLKNGSAGSNDILKIAQDTKLSVKLRREDLDLVERLTKHSSISKSDLLNLLISDVLVSIVKRFPPETSAEIARTADALMSSDQRFDSWISVLTASRKKMLREKIEILVNRYADRQAKETKKTENFDINDIYSRWLPVSDAIVSETRTFSENKQVKIKFYELPEGIVSQPKIEDIFPMTAEKQQKFLKSLEPIKEYEAKKRLENPHAFLVPVTIQLEKIKKETWDAFTGEAETALNNYFSFVNKASRGPYEVVNVVEVKELFDDSLEKSGKLPEKFEGRSYRTIHHNSDVIKRAVSVFNEFTESLKSGASEEAGNKENGGASQDLYRHLKQYFMDIPKHMAELGVKKPKFKFSTINLNVKNLSMIKALTMDLGEREKNAFRRNFLDFLLKIQPIALANFIDNRNSDEETHALRIDAAIETYNLFKDESAHLDHDLGTAAGVIFYKKVIKIVEDTQA